MPMVHVESMGMDMRRRLVPVRMRVFAAGKDVVGVVVVAVVVRVRMIVLNGPMRMLVLVRLREMEPHARHEEDACPEGRRAGHALAQRPGERGPNERSRREDRPGPRRADLPLRTEVEREAGAIAQRTA